LPYYQKAVYHFLKQQPVCHRNRYAKCRLKRKELKNLWGQKQTTGSPNGLAETIP